MITPTVRITTSRGIVAHEVDCPCGQPLTNSSTHCPRCGVSFHAA